MIGHPACFTGVSRKAFQDFRSLPFFFLKPAQMYKNSVSVHGFFLYLRPIDKKWDIFEDF